MENVGVLVQRKDLPRVSVASVKSIVLGKLGLTLNNFYMGNEHLYLMQMRHFPPYKGRKGRLIFLLRFLWSSSTFLGARERSSSSSSSLWRVMFELCVGSSSFSFLRQFFLVLLGFQRSKGGSPRSMFSMVVDIFELVWWRHQGGNKLAFRSFVGRTEWHENSTLIQGIEAVGCSCGLSGPLDSPTSEASLLSFSISCLSSWSTWGWHRCNHSTPL